MLCALKTVTLFLKAVEVAVLQEEFVASVLTVWKGPLEIVLPNSPHPYYCHQSRFSYSRLHRHPDRLCMTTVTFLGSLFHCSMTCNISSTSHLDETSYGLVCAHYLLSCCWVLLQKYRPHPSVIHPLCIYKCGLDLPQCSTLHVKNPGEKCLSISLRALHVP